MLKVKLLNDGGYLDLNHVKFPIVVDATKMDGNTAWVNLRAFVNFNTISYPFTIGVDCEVIDEE